MITFSGTKINTIYYNDLHGSTKNIDTFLHTRDEFYNSNQSGANFTLCGGDMFVDKNSNNEIVAKKLGAKTDAISAGNHDLEAGNYLASLIKKFNLQKKFLSANITYKKSTPLSKTISKSTIIENNGEKIGVIGISPFDFNKLAFMNEDTNFIKIKDLTRTVQAIRNEVKKLESRDINKIFLLAHTGNYSKDGQDYYKKLAKIGGIDVIIGGHDHIETDRWETTERGEPVKIVATGRSKTHDFGKNLDYIGKLYLEFDENGILIQNKCRNVFEKLKPSISKSGKVIYKLDKPLINSDPLTDNSQAGNLIADSNLWYVNKHTKGAPADFAFVNAGTLRDNFDTQEITDADIKSVVPFTTSTLIKAPLTKKQIINTLNWCCESTSFGKISPGLMQVSGMEYTINPDLTVSDVHILNEDGSVKYNLDDFDNNDEFSAVYDVFLATGVAGLKDLKKDCENDKSIEFFNASRQKALLNYLTDCKNMKNYTTPRINKHYDSDT